MIRLRPTRSELIEIVVLTVIAAVVMLGLRSRVLTDSHFAFFAGNYTMYLVWRAAAAWRERTKRSRGAVGIQHDTAIPT